jgi:hypothetical protein
MLLAAASPVAAQSLFNAAGVGLPLDAVDGRARALGSLGIGLPGAMGLLPADPAAAARMPVPGGLIVAQPTWVDLTRDGSSAHRYFRGSRFPVVAAGYPVLRGMATLHATAFLDQRFRGERPVTVDLLGVTSEAVDVFEQDGSVSTLAVGYARMLTPTIAAGLSAGRYAGSVDRRLVRQFADSAAAGRAIPYGLNGTWSYHGYQVTLGASADVGFLRIAASATASTDIDAVATSRTEGADLTFSIPLQLRLGASGQLAPGLLMSASAARADWSSTAEDLGGGARAGATNAFGVGLELSQLRWFGRSAPFRLGFRRTDLPFSLEGGSANEQAFTGGMGFALNETNEVVLATVDLGLEKGRRIGGSYREDFWRATLSLRMLGF